MMKLIATIQDNHHDWTYNQIRAELKNNYSWNLRPSNYTIANALNQSDMTTKMIEYEEPERNTPAAIAYRKEFSKKALEENATIGTEYLVFIDEQGYDLHRTRRRGRSKKGMKAIIQRKKSQGVHWSVCAAINEQFGVMHSEIITGGFAGEQFLQFMQDLLKHAAFRLHSYVFVLDNARSHHTQALRDLIEFGTPVQHKLRFNPPYSPQLNAIEYCFSSWASYVRRYEKSAENLRTLIKEAEGTTTNDKIKGWVRLVTRNLLSCLDGAPLNYPFDG